MNISGLTANIPLVKQSYKNLLALGEGANAADFRMIIGDYDDLEYLVQATQLPALKREMIETKGPHGVVFNQQGNFVNAGDITITFKEVVQGKAYEALRKIVKNKEYIQIELALISESSPESPEAVTVILEDCWLELDAADLSVDDGTTLVKPTGTIHYNWITWLDEDGFTLSWE